MNVTQNAVLASKPCCKVCSSVVREPWIHCAACKDPTNICLKCFAQGREVGLHENNHDYIVVKHDFPIYDKSWSAAEELRLLDAIEDCGLGNWNDISKKVQSKSANDCRRHYFRYYIENPKPPFPSLPCRSLLNHCNPLPYTFQDDPPRPQEGTSLQTDMSGYNAARSDFSTEFNNYAEMMIADMDISSQDSGFEIDLKLTVLDIYRNALQERERRKTIIRRHGLINTRRALLHERQYHMSIGPSLVDKLRVFMRLVPPDNWNQFLELLSVEKTLCSEIKTLQEWRDQGVVNLRSGEVYETLKDRRTTYQPKLMDYILKNVKDNVAVQKWNFKYSTELKLNMQAKLPNASRKQAAALDITGLPKYDRLTEREKVLCGSLRLIPASYLDYKDILTHENKKYGGLRLKQARTALKIDVNKTRKLYNFLVDEGYIDKIK